jgi:hypothetical protein
MRLWEQMAKLSSEVNVKKKTLSGMGSERAATQIRESAEHDLPACKIAKHGLNTAVANRHSRVGELA